LKSNQQNKVVETLERARSIGGFNALLEFEQSKGFAAVFPGEVPWLSAADWPPNIVVTLNGKTVRIVAIYAKRPGNGAFSRLIRNIVAAGLSPVVIAPMLTMPAILAHWGWTSRQVGHDFDTWEEQWYPSAIRAAKAENSGGGRR
jgi:hypothetical protein